MAFFPAETAGSLDLDEVDASPRVLTSHSERTVGRAYRVLVIDDLPAIHTDLRKVLCESAETNSAGTMEAMLFGEHRRGERTRMQFEIEGALQGEAGIELARQAVATDRPFAVAFVDMRMPPGSDGLKTILALWQVDPDIQVVICSAYCDYSWDEIFEITGETDQLVILRKPFEAIEVLQLAHALAKKWTLQRSARQHVHDLEALISMRTEELGEKRALFQLIVDNVTDLIAVVDANGNRIYNSPSYHAVLGFTPEELSRTHALAQIHPDDVPVVERAIAQARATGRGDVAVYRMRHRDGSWRTLESCAGIVRGSDGQLAYFVIVARDITQRHERELNSQLSQKLESIGGLAAGIAHEINTPTQYITDNTRFLLDAFQQFAGVLASWRAQQPSGATGPATPAPGLASGTREAKASAELDYLLAEIPRALQQNLEGLARVSRIVGSLKEFSHPNSPDQAPADLHRAIETATAVCRHEWKYVADVTTDFDPNLPLVPCVLDEFNQVILNLVVNAAHTIADALKARGETRGQITVRTVAEPDWAVIEVTDTGMGIPPEVRDRIFEPFFTTKEVGRGTGQGLAIVHAVVVKHHRGSVDFQSEVGRGTTFRLRLPLKKPN